MNNTQCKRQRVEDEYSNLWSGNGTARQNLSAKGKRRAVRPAAMPALDKGVRGSDAARRREQL
ncbi:hypothetical protein BJ165DRAFT_1499438 [Panaeolus papilionaceus]|nr:hypothetical protein BJ165DRAFT_1499438 [Panaeolus papilionaceus]